MTMHSHHVGSINKGKITRALTLTPYAIIVLAFIVGAAFTFLQTDDFCTFGRVTWLFGGNPLLDVHNLYMHWTGRYSASLLVDVIASLGKFIPLEIAYPLMLAAFLVLFAWACVRFSRLMDDAQRRPSLALAAVTASAILLLTPSKLEQFFWLTGASVYFVGASIVLVLIQIIGSEPRDGKSSWAREGWLCFFIFLAVGFNEFLAVVLGVCLAWSLYEAKRITQAGAARLVTFLGAFALTLFAPGNFARDASSSLPRHDVMIATKTSIAGISAFFGALDMQHYLIPLACMVIGSVAAGAMLSIPPEDRGVNRARSAIPYLLILIAAFPMHFWIYSFLTGDATPGRIINQALMLAVCALCMILAMIGRAARNANSFGIASFAPALLFVAAGAAMVASTEFRIYAHTLRAFAPRWRAEQVARHDGLHSLLGSSASAYVRPYSSGDSTPPIFKGSDITSDANNWVNRCVADYYKIHAVTQMRRTSY